MSQRLHRQIRLWTFHEPQLYTVNSGEPKYREMLIGDVDGPLEKVQVEVRWQPIGGCVSLCDMERFGKLSKHCLELLWQEDERKHDALFGILEQFIFLPYESPKESFYWPSKTMQINTEWDCDVRVFMGTLVPRLLQMQQWLDDMKTNAIRNRIIKE